MLRLQEWSLRLTVFLTLALTAYSVKIFDQAEPLDAEYDIIFAGGGAAAMITASRVATALPRLRILVLETGPSSFQKIEHIQPGRYFSHLAPWTNTETHHIATASPHVNGRNVVVQSGRVTGGGGSVNFMLYNRPAASDFDDWGAEGWAAKDMIPMFQKAENYEIERGRPTHGTNGPLKVSYGTFQTTIGEQFLDVGPKIEPTRPLGPDGNEFSNKSINIFYKMPKWISSNGRRSDSAHGYTFSNPAQNLFVSVGTRVKRVTFSDKVATGLEYVYDKRIFPLQEQSVHTVRAKSLVVLAAGAMGSPAILERSGIGRREVLQAAGVQQLVDLPGVGENYQDHLFYVSPYVVDDATTTFDAIFRNSFAEWLPGLGRWAADGGGILGANGVDAAIKMRPSDAEVAELGPDFTDRWNTFFKNKTDKPLFWLAALGGLPADPNSVPSLKYMSTGVMLAYPTGRGSVHISTQDIYVDPTFDSGFLNGDKSDLAILRWGYKKGREIVRRMGVFRAALTPAHPQFADSSAARHTDQGPVALNAPKITYSAEDDAAIDDNIRNLITTTWHALGTNAMKPRDQGGVVDNKLNVYGVSKLKIADISIPPSNINANPFSTAVAIGERAALIIMAEFGVRTLT